jgi:hypothetical protein
LPTDSIPARRSAHLFVLTRSLRTVMFGPLVGESGSKWGKEARNVQRRSRRLDGWV